MTPSTPRPAAPPEPVLDSERLAAMTEPLMPTTQPHPWISKSGRPYTARVRSPACARCGATPDAPVHLRAALTAADPAPATHACAKCDYGTGHADPAPAGHCGDMAPHEPHDDEGTSSGRYVITTCPGTPDPAPAGVSAHAPHHHGNHDGYACGLSGSHCWSCNEPWPCRARRAEYDGLRADVLAGVIDSDVLRSEALGDDPEY